jgi:3-mercaptopyruvate sulfurtransferase SseA
VALLLKRRGIERVRPLAGGFDAWLEAGHPVEPFLPDATPPQSSSATPKPSM